MTKYFVVSDVHSFYDAMIDALNKQGFDIENPDHKVIVCGDLFDRGPDTVKCFEFCSALNEADRLIYICGNHEDLLFQCVHELLQFRFMFRIKLYKLFEISERLPLAVLFQPIMLITFADH